jgi:hypothetical protein
MGKHTIINLKKKGHSNRGIEKITGINRKTIAKYWKEYVQQSELLNDPTEDIPEIQETIVAAPKYDSSNRGSRKYSNEMDKRLDQILNLENRKTRLLGPHKQNLTRLQIHSILVSEGYDIGYSTIAGKINEKVNKNKECFIRQSYELGDRLEYDFGEIKLLINGVSTKYYMAVVSSPAADFRWAFIYKNQKKEAFMDYHVKIFEMVGGVYRELVYDNMRNVVKKFIGRNKKELNEDLIKMAIYYGYEINVTNCFSGNEKGHVEGSVKIIRNHVFAINYEFISFEDAQDYLNSQLIKMNSNSKIQEEMLNLLPYKPKLELANMTINKVSKYSFIQIENNFYSVPEYLVGKSVNVKSYFDRILIYANNSKVCEHKKIDGFKELSVDITHYLNSLRRKPGAIKNSVALKSIPKLKTIYDNHFNTNPKKFIEILIDNKEKDIDSLMDILEKYVAISNNVLPVDNISSTSDLFNATRYQISRYNELSIRGGKTYEN